MLVLFECWTIINRHFFCTTRIYNQMSQHSALRAAAVPDNSTLILVSDPPPILQKLDPLVIRQWLRQLHGWRLRNADSQLSIWRLFGGDISNQLVLMLHRGKAPISDLFKSPVAATSGAVDEGGKDTRAARELETEMEKLISSPSSSPLLSPEGKTMATKTSLVLAESSEDEVLRLNMDHVGSVSPWNYYDG